MSNLRKPSIQATIRGADFVVASLSASGAVNGLPTITLEGHYPKDAKATAQSSAAPLVEIMRKAGEVQNYILNTERLVPDVIVQASDGAGRSMNFRGFLTSPGHSIGNGSVSVRYTAVHEAAVLSMFDGSIYSPIITRDGEQDIKAVLVSFTFKSKSFSGMLLEFTEFAIKKFEEITFTSNGATSTDILIQDIHKRNSQVLDYLKSVLKNSETSTSYGEVMSKLVPGTPTELIRAIAACLTEGPNFMEALIGIFCRDFVSVFRTEPVPQILLVDVVNSEGAPVEFPAEAISFSGGGNYSIPLKGVLVITTHDAAVNIGTGVYVNHVDKVAAFYPPSATNGGTFIRVGAPNWLPANLPALGLTYEKLNKVNAGASPTTASIKTGRQRLTDVFLESQNVATALATLYAKSTFSYTALASSQASVSVPLHFGMKPGHVYTVSAASEAGGGIKLFTGFAQSVTHNLSGNKSAVSASTSIMFSHIRIADAELPGGNTTIQGLTLGRIGLDFVSASGTLGGSL